MDKNFTKHIIEDLAHSDIYRKYERAFREATHLPLTIRPLLDEPDVESSNDPYDSPFCDHLKDNHNMCESCRKVLQEMQTFSDHSAHSVICFTGLTESAVPIHLNNEVVGYLQTGQVFLKDVDEKEEKTVKKNLMRLGVDLSKEKDLEDLYYKNRVFSPKQYEATLRLLEIFAEELSQIVEEMVIQEDEKEPPRIKKAKRYIHDHLDDDLSLDDVANSVNWSAYYFSRMFKKATGLNFVDYVARVRIDQAKKLLLNPHLNVSEIAYEVGFQSITHFNRVFRKLTGTSPTDYRKQNYYS